MDLASYGSALAIINQFADDNDVKVFEVSPIGQAALLILMTQEAMAVEVLKNEILSQWAFAVTNLTTIQEIHDDLLKVYLSQKQAPIDKNILVLESQFVSEALSMADILLKNAVQLLDLRIVRTYPSNTIITATSPDKNKLLEFSKANKRLKSTLITEPQPILKSFFEIIP